MKLGIIRIGVFCFLFFVLGLYAGTSITTLKMPSIDAHEEINELRRDVRFQQDIIQAYHEQVVDLKAEQRVEWGPVEMELTGYAPLDPQAVEGVCYSGDPTVTASGEPSQPGISIAAGPSVPFGTEIYVPGYGVGVVHDRGGLISDKHIDLMFATRGQALNWGRQTMTVWVKE